MNLSSKEKPILSLKKVNPSFIFFPHFPISFATSPTIHIRYQNDRDYLLASSAAIDWLRQKVYFLGSQDWWLRIKALSRRTLNKPSKEELFCIYFVRDVVLRIGGQ